MNTLVRKVGSWGCFGLLLLSLFSCLSAWGQGTIVYVRLSTPNPDPNFRWDFEGMRLSGGRSYNLDFNNDGTPEYVIYAGGHSTTPFGIRPQGGNAVWAERPFDSSFAAALSPGVVVGASLTSPPFGWIQDATGQGAVFSGCVDILCLGHYTGLDWAYSALRFDLNGQTHYGWVRVGSPIGGNFGWIYDYAYDTRPGAPILTGAIPEPSMLALLIVGIAVLFAGRRAMTPTPSQREEKP